MVCKSDFHHSICDEQACQEIVPSDFVRFGNLDYDFSELKQSSTDFLFDNFNFDKNKNVGLTKQEETNELKMSKINLTTSNDQKR